MEKTWGNDPAKEHVRRIQSEYMQNMQNDAQRYIIIFWQQQDLQWGRR